MVSLLRVLVQRVDLGWILYHVGPELTLSLDCRLVLKSSLLSKAFKSILGKTLEFLSTYDGSLFIGVSVGLKIILKCVNPSQKVGNIQTNTIKARMFFYGLLYLGYLFFSFLTWSWNSSMKIFFMLHKTKVKNYLERNRGTTERRINYERILVSSRRKMLKEIVTIEQRRKSQTVVGTMDTPVVLTVRACFVFFFNDIYYWGVLDWDCVWSYFWSSLWTTRGFVWWNQSVNF